MSVEHAQKQVYFGDEIPPSVNRSAINDSKIFLTIDHSAKHINNIPPSDLSSSDGYSARDHQQSLSIKAGFLKSMESFKHHMDNFEDKDDQPQPPPFVLLKNIENEKSSSQSSSRAFDSSRDKRQLKSNFEFDQGQLLVNQTEPDRIILGLSSLQDQIRTECEANYLSPNSNPPKGNFNFGQSVKEFNSSNNNNNNNPHSISQFLNSQFLQQNSISSLKGGNSSRNKSIALVLQKGNSRHSQLGQYCIQRSPLSQQIEGDEGERNKFRPQMIMDFLNSKDKKPPKRNLLKQIYYIRKISNILKNRLNRKRLNQMEEVHFKAINDKASSFGNLKPSQQVKSISRVISFQILSILKSVFTPILNYIEVFSPDSIYIMMWNICVLLMQLMQLAVYPVKSAFQVEEANSSSTAYIVFFTIPIILSVSEAILHVNFAFYEQGTLINTRSIILRKYIQNKFPFDASCICLLYINYQQGYFLVDLLFAILSLKKIFLNLKSINEHFQIEQRFQTTYDLTNLILLVFYMAHYCACGFYYVGSSFIDNDYAQVNWISKYNFQNETWMSNYVNSLYFTFITMITVGFGDIVPINTYEKIYVIFMTLVSCGVFAYAVNTIGRIFSDIAQREAVYKTQKFEITRFMRQRNITKATQRKVLKYIEYEHNQELESDKKGEEILMRISKSLKDEVSREYFGKFLFDIKLFRLNFTKEFLMQLSSHIKEKAYGPNEIVFSQGDKDRNFYFVCGGSIQLYLHKHNNTLNRDEDFDLISVGKGSLLGLNSFFTGNPKEMSARSLNMCHVIFCSEADFLSTIKLYEKDYEKYCALRDSVNLYNDHQGLPCMSCGRFDHQAHACSLYSLKTDKQLVNFRHIFSPFQQRSKKQRRDGNEHNALKHRVDTQMTLRKIRLHYLNLIYMSPSSSSNFSKESDEDCEDEDRNGDDDDDDDNVSVELQNKISKKSNKVSTPLNIEAKIRSFSSDRQFFKSVEPLQYNDIRAYLFSQGLISHSALSYEQQNDQSSGSESQIDHFEGGKVNKKKRISHNRSGSFKSSSSSEEEKSERNDGIPNSFGDIPPTQPTLALKGEKTSTEKKLQFDIAPKVVFHPYLQGTDNEPIETYQQHRKRSSGSVMAVAVNFDPEQESVLSTVKYSKQSTYNEGTNSLKLQIPQPKIKRSYSRDNKSSIANSDVEKQSNFGSANRIQFIQNGMTNDERPINSQFRGGGGGSSSNISPLAPATRIGGSKLSKVKSGSQEGNKAFTILQKQLSTINNNSSNRIIGREKTMIARSSFHLQHQVLREVPSNHIEIYDMFDRMKDYSCYFPQSNISIVLKEARRRANQIAMLARLNRMQGAASSNKYSAPENTQTNGHLTLPNYQSFSKN